MKREYAKKSPEDLSLTHLRRVLMDAEKEVDLGRAEVLINLAKVWVDVWTQQIFTAQEVARVNRHVQLKVTPDATTATLHLMTDE